MTKPISGIADLDTPVSQPCERSKPPHLDYLQSHSSSFNLVKSANSPNRHERYHERHNDVLDNHLKGSISILSDAFNLSHPKVTTT